MAIFSSSISVATWPPPFALTEPTMVAGHSCQTSLPLSLPADMLTAFTLTRRKGNIKEYESISTEVSPYCFINVT